MCKQVKHDKDIDQERQLTSSLEIVNFDASEHSLIDVVSDVRIVLLLQDFLQMPAQVSALVVVARRLLGDAKLRGGHGDVLQFAECVKLGELAVLLREALNDRFRSVLRQNAQGEMGWRERIGVG
jgi:hypothetical protein